VRSRFATLTAVLGSLILLVGCGSGSTTTSLSAIKSYHPIPDSPLGPATQSVNQDDGSSWTFDKPASGKLTLVYFGYTSCPDICPTTMADLASAMTRLPSSLVDKVWVQFVSTDPHRDTAKRLTRWLGSYSPTFHGARAPIGQVIAAARTYGIPISAPKITPGDYQVTHGEQVLVLNQHGSEVGFFTGLAGSKAYAEALPTLIKEYA
jgi:protein SCO1/2